MTTDNPMPIPNPVNTNGILPGHGWPSDLLGDDESFAEYFASYVFPFEDQALLHAIIAQAKMQWSDLFPDADERDRLMFIAGVLCLQYWWAYQSLTTRNQAMEEGDPYDDVLVTLDDVDAWTVTTVARLVSLIHDITDDPDLDDAFADVIEGMDE